MRMVIVLLIFSMAMILAGLYLLVAQFLWAPVIDVKVVLGATALIALGACLLWEEFIAPVFGIEIKK